MIPLWEAQDIRMTQTPQVGIHSTVALCNGGMPLTVDYSCLHSFGV